MHFLCKATIAIEVMSSLCAWKMCFSDEFRLMVAVLLKSPMFCS